MNNVMKRIRWILKWLVYMYLAAACDYGFTNRITVIHVQFNVCPLHFDQFTQNQLRPVIYGLPTEKTIQAVRRGEVFLGGCILGPEAAICPYCWFPARFLPWVEPSAIPLDEKAMNGLSSPESQAVRQYATQIIAQTQIDADERITALLVTPTDVWLGTFYRGLHRFQRKTMSWRSYTGTSIGYCIKSIRKDGTRIYVEHDTIGNGLFYEDYTDDRGATWKRP